MIPSVRDTIEATFDQHPRAPLSEVGFRMACYVALSRIWPDVTPDEAIAELADYCGGPKADQWTYAQVQFIAQEFTSEFGE